MINHTLRLAASIRETQKNNVLTIPAGGKRLDIRHDDIIYAEVLDQRCILYLRNGLSVDISTDMNIDDLETMLPKPRFLRTHRAYIVNLDMVKRSNGTDFVMKNDGIAYITQRNYRHIMKLYDEWLFGRVMEDGI
jgi:DNA-binding LytR/AlgR family response regulator